MRRFVANHFVPIRIETLYPLVTLRAWYWHLASLVLLPTISTEYKPTTVLIILCTELGTGHRTDVSTKEATELNRVRITW
jgi:hypothetical protein